MRVNSFTLFGDRQRWAPNFAGNIRQHLVMYPGWVLWVYTDAPLEGGYMDVLRTLAEIGVIRVTIVPNDGKVHQQRRLCTQMLWRMLPLWQNTEYVFCRDLDSILTPRQLQCVRSFIASGKTAHGINDNPAHCIPLMGGMSGFHTESFGRAMEGRSLDDLMADFASGRWDVHGTDQDFLMCAVWPFVVDDSLIHQIQGGNDRSMNKRVTEADISDIPQAVRERGDDFTNYIGAQGTATDHGSFSVRDICDFYDQHCEACHVVREVEESLGWITTPTEGIFKVRCHNPKTPPATSTPPSKQAIALSAT